MDVNDDKRQELITRAIAVQGAGAGSASGSAGIEPWTLLAAHLCPLIGDSGFSALYRRSARMMAGRHTWLLPQESSTIDELLAALRAQLASADPASASEANAALLNTFTKLLAVLIGEALTIRVLRTAWNGTARTANAREQS